MQHAHRNLVIHRDLKPSNILVDAEGRPKLLDFGIAKLLAPASNLADGEPTLADEEATLTVMRLMTPSYASPEQILGETLSTATDVFSLGVLLYELLTGEHPYRGRSRTPGELERLICEVDPEKPSLVTSSAQLRRWLAGDLDNIVLMAMRKEPARRYGTAEQLADDVRRYLDGLPVKARKQTWRYLGAKFVRRQRLVVAMAALVAATVLGFAMTALEQHRRTVEERDRAELTRSFLVDLFELSEPGRARGQAITAREILDRGATRIREMEGQPEMQAELMATVGRVYLKMELFEAARPLLERALELRRQVLGTGDPAVAASLHDLADLLLLEGGDHERAQELCVEALALHRRRYGETHPEVARSLTCLAEIHHAQGDYEPAESLYRRALDMRRHLLGPEHVDLAASLNGLALLYHDWGVLDRAEPLYEEALEMRRRLLAPQHPHLATSLNNLAALLHKKGRLADAEALFREAVDMQRRLLGDRNPSLGGSLQNLALLISDRGDYAAAEALLREVVDIQREHLADDHPDRATTLYNLGRVVEKRGDSEQAAGLYRDAVVAYRRSLPPDHPWLAFPLLTLGKLLVRTGDAASAEALLSESLAIRRAALPAGQWRTGESASALGECLAVLGREAEAEPLLRDGYETVRSARGNDDEWTRGARARLVRFYEARGEASKAEKVAAADQF